MTMSDIAKEVGLSKKTIHYRLKRLEEGGLIRFKVVKNTRGNQKIIVPVGKKVFTQYKAMMDKAGQYIEDMFIV